jgi:hypothetical protein
MLSPSFNPSEVGMVMLRPNVYQINANDRLEDEIVIFGHLPFTFNGVDCYINEEGVKVFVK